MEKGLTKWIALIALVRLNLNRPPDPPEPSKSRFRRPIRVKLQVSHEKLLWSVTTLGVLSGAFLAYELNSSKIQSKLFADLASELHYSLERGPSETARFPEQGPYNARLGYDAIPAMTARLQTAGFDLVAQARPSEKLLEWMDRGLPAVYPEKTQAGLRILDEQGRIVFDRRHPEFVYESFEEIPPVVVDTLRFIENREILRPGSPYRNPAVEWDRLAQAVLDLGLNRIFPRHPVSGGSTLAVQLEKLRHSEGGRTSGVEDKLRQMTAASLRSYLRGERTADSQRKIVLDYMNSIPLSGQDGFGEVRGLGDGLWAWYGADFSRTNQLLSTEDEDLPKFQAPEKARAYRQALSLLLALRRPTLFLLEDPDKLHSRTESYLRLLAQAGVISRDLRDRALRDRIEPLSAPPPRPRPAFVDSKAADGVRMALLGLMERDSLYDLDRLDLTVRSTLDERLRADASKELGLLQDPEHADRAGIVGYRLLEHEQLEDVVYSFTLYEKSRLGNVLRVQADNWDQPLNINEGTKLELGSTAKLRTLISYLQTIRQLHDQLARLEPQELNAVRHHPGDRLTSWTLEHLRTAENISLEATLEAAMLRMYSASPREGFFTGGGLHYFHNFDSKNNGGVFTVREAFQRSINLVFIRLMRDIVRHHVYGKSETDPAILTDPSHPKRQEFLERFADAEGRQFLADFYRKHKELTHEESIKAMAAEKKRSPRQLAALYRFVSPDAEFADFAESMRRALPGWRLSDRTLQGFYDVYDADEFNLNDRAYLARLHPLELWLVRRLDGNPSAGWRQLAAESWDARQQSYIWLFKTRHKKAQDNRIRTLLEEDAFTELHRQWRRLGYPFGRLVPSYATAIGSSADRPDALAKLIGIVLNDGVRRPAARVLQLSFGEGTPYETVLRRRALPGVQVMHPAVARAARAELINVVQNGTGRRARGAIQLADDSSVPIGGKTGTGDNRFETFTTGGRLVESRVVNRTATFVFLVGDRFFGTVTAYVPGEQAAEHNFTSALPVQVFKRLAPSLLPLLERGRPVAMGFPAARSTAAPAEAP